MKKKKTKKTESSRKKQIYLPHELLSEILSRLDVPSLLRFKTVCKEWCSLMDDPAFIRAHMKKRKAQWVYEKVRANNGPLPRNKYYCLDRCYGIILEHNKQNSYRLRNPSTREILALPDPGAGKPSEIGMCQIESSDTLKLAIALPNAKYERGKMVRKVLSVGIDTAWRDIVIPFASDALALAPRTTMMRGVYYVVCFVLDSSPSGGRLEVICLDMGSEQFSSIRVPDGCFSNPYNDVPRNWRGRLAIVDEAAAEDEIRIWVLEDRERVRWAEEKVAVPLEFLGPRRVGRGKVCVCGFKGDDVLVTCDCCEGVLLLEVPSGKIKERFLAPEGQELAYKYVPTLQRLKGGGAIKHEEYF